MLYSMIIHKHILTVDLIPVYTFKTSEVTWAFKQLLTQLAQILFFFLVLGNQNLQIVTQRRKIISNKK